MCTEEQCSSILFLTSFFFAFFFAFFFSLCVTGFLRKSRRASKRTSGADPRLRVSCVVTAAMLLSTVVMASGDSSAVGPLYALADVKKETATEARPQSLVNIVTTCGTIDAFPEAAARDSLVLSPLSLTICKPAATINPATQTADDTSVMTGAQYARLYEGMLRVVHRTGTFWLNPASYVESNPPESVTLDVQLVEGAEELEIMWSVDAAEALPQMCASLIACQDNVAASDAVPSPLPAACVQFETEAAAWIRQHLNWPAYGSIVETAYPNLGFAGMTMGTLIADMIGS